MSSITLDSPSVQSYLTILQGVINRMAANSAGCKTWCVALVSAVIVIIVDKVRPEYVWLSLVPIVLFFFLDAYYLGLERQFRDQYNEFIRKIHTGAVVIDDIFIVTPGGGTKVIILETAKSFSSISIWPFYGLLILMLVFVRIWIMQAGC